MWKNLPVGIKIVIPVKSVDIWLVCQGEQIFVFPS